MGNFNELTKKDYVNIIIEGAAMFFLMVAYLFICGDGDLKFYNFHKGDFIAAIMFFQIIATWILMYIRKIHNRFVAVLSYTFIICTIFYMITDTYYGDAKLKESSLFLVFIVMVLAWLAVRHVHYQYYKDKFYIPYLSEEQAYAVIGLLAFIQGSSPSSAYSSEANQIVQSMINKLGLSQHDIEKYLKSSLNSAPDECINRLINSLKGIQDHDFMQRLRDNCTRIAEISDNKETKEMIHAIFCELGV